MTSGEVQKQIALYTGRGPARAALYSDPEILKKNPKFSSEFEIFASAQPRPRTPVYLPLSNIMAE